MPTPETYGPVSGAPSRAVTVSTRAVAAAAITASVAFPVNEVLSIAYQPAIAQHVALLVLATVCYLPLFLRHVLAGLHGGRPRGAGWSLAGIAALLAAMLVVLGPTALAMLPALVVSAMLALRPPWALALVVGVAAATTPVALALDDTEFALWYPVAVLWRSLTLYVLISLVAAARELDRLRRELAESALLRERLRLDDELRATVGAALVDLAARGERLQALADTPRVAAELPALVAASRSTLAAARRMVTRYQRPSLHAELSAAAALLGAAGIAVRVAADPGRLGTDVEESLRAQLHAETTRLLLAGPRPPGEPALLLGVRPDSARLLVSTDGPPRQVTR